MFVVFAQKNMKEKLRGLRVLSLLSPLTEQKVNNPQ